MIYLNPGTNSICLTLGDQATLVQPYYTFQLTRKGSYEDIIFYQDDGSPIPYYWNTFTISVGTVSGLTSGMIVANGGEWTYNVYQMSEPYNLNLASASSLLQTGICIISSTFAPISGYTGSNSDTIKYYQN